MLLAALALLTPQIARLQELAEFTPAAVFAANEDTLIIADRDVFSIHGRTLHGWELDQILPLSDGGLYTAAIAEGRILERVCVLGFPRHGELGSRAGAAYVLEREASGWVEVAKLLASDGADQALFGTSVGLEPGRIVIGAPGRQTVYVFERVGGVWSEVQRLRMPADDASFADFGKSVDLQQGTLLVGSPYGGPQPNGSAHFYEHQGGAFARVARVHGGLGAFGFDVDLDLPRAAIIGPGSSDDSLPPPGVVHVFLRNGGTWEQEAALEEPGVQYDQGFEGVLLNGDELFAGAPDAAVAPGTSRVLRFRRDATGWGFVEAIALEQIVAFLGDTIAVTSAAIFVRRFGASTSHLYELPRDVHPATTAYCFCDTGAPCANEDPASGCQNSTGVGARMTAHGEPSVASDGMQFALGDLPPHTPVVVGVGGLAARLPLGNGLLCIASGQSGVRRFPLGASDANGRARLGPSLAGYSTRFAPMAHFLPGRTFYFQAAYRDPLGPCAAGLNLTNAVSVTFQN